MYFIRALRDAFSKIQMHIITIIIFTALLLLLLLLFITLMQGGYLQFCTRNKQFVYSM